MSPKRKRYITGFVLLFVLYSIYFLTARDGFFYLIHTSRKERHIITFVTILLVYGAGLWALNKYFPLWTRSAWNLLHIVFIAVLILFGVFDWSMGGLPKSSRHFTQTIAETLVSPVLYVAIGLLDWSITKFPDQTKAHNKQSSDH